MTRVPSRPPPRFVVTGVVAARRALRRLSDRLIPAELALFDNTIAVGRTHVIGTLAELGVADELAAGPATAAEIAERVGANADALHRVMRAACVEGLFEMDSAGRFSLTRLSQPLRSDSPVSMRSWARYMALRSSTSAWADLTGSVRTGESAFQRVHGMSVWEWFAKHPDEETLFAGGMRRITEQDAPLIVAGYPWPEAGAVCDVAGGVGTLLAALLEARPRLTGVLVDGPGPLAEARGLMERAGLTERVELAEGDIFERVNADADVFVLKDVLHDWDDERCIRILRTVRATMKPGARIVLVEMLQERNEPHPFASLEDVQMLTQCDGGRQRSADELAGLMRAADLRPGTVRPTIGPALVEGIAES
jgi:hypothetical protein